MKEHLFNHIPNNGTERERERGNDRERESLILTLCTAAHLNARLLVL